MYKNVVNSWVAKFTNISPAEVFLREADKPLVETFPEAAGKQLVEAEPEVIKKFGK